MMMIDAGPVFAMGATAEGGSPLVQVIPFVLILAIFYFVILLPGKKKQQKVQEFLDNLKENDRVITTGGIYGQIAKISGDKVQLQIADKVRIDVSKAAIGGYQGQLIAWEDLTKPKPPPATPLG